MIPKIIHYCWFGGKEIPADLQECIDSWSKLKGYTVMRWDESNCSFDENEFVRKTYAEKKLGFIGDYYRLKAIFEYGGIYLDTDVMVNKSFDKLLTNKMFLNFIFDDSVGTAIIGAEPHHPLVRSLMDMYDKTVFGHNESGRTFEWENGNLIVNGYATSNYYYTYNLLKHYDKFILNNKYQDLGDFVIYPKELFEIGSIWNNHYAIHECSGTWKIKVDNSKSLKNIIKKNLKRIPWVYRKVQIIVRSRRYRKAKKDIPFYECYLAQKRGEKIPEL